MQNRVTNTGATEYSVADLMREIAKAQSAREQRNQRLAQALAVIDSSSDPKIRKALQTATGIVTEMMDENREMLSLYGENGR